MAPIIPGRTTCAVAVIACSIPCNPSTLPCRLICASSSSTSSSSRPSTLPICRIGARRCSWRKSLVRRQKCWWIPVIIQWEPILRRSSRNCSTMIGSLNPFELFCIFNEIVGASADGNANTARIAYMIDQSHNIEPKIEAMIQSVLNVQTAYAKALLVDRAALQKAQEAGDVLAAYRVLQAAYETDVRSLLSAARVRQGLAPDPIAAFRASGYAERVAQERSATTTASGYPGS